MSQETRQNLFNPDYTTKSYGTGLGMAIVRRIITVHGGEIAVESEENVGTTIRITFNESSYLTETTPAMILHEIMPTSAMIDDSIGFSRHINTEFSKFRGEEI